MYYLEKINLRIPYFFYNIYKNKSALSLILLSKKENEKKQVDIQL